METELIKTQNPDTRQTPQSALSINNTAPEQFHGFQSKQQGTYDKLNQLFTEQDQQNKTVLVARETIGESAEALTDSQVYDLVNEIQYLVDSWLEEYERQVFKGNTLNELAGLDK